MIQINYKEFLKISLKILVLIFLIYFISSNIDLKKTINALIETNLFYLTLAFVFFVLSQFISSIRLKFLLLKIDINIGYVNNFKLYLLGMFYNLFLPGGIGGDAYKVIKYSQINNSSKKTLLKLLVGDRLSGLIVLIFFSLIFVSVIPPIKKFEYYMFLLFEIRYFLIPLLAVLIIYLSYKLLMKMHFIQWVKFYSLAFAVQFLQLLSFFCIAKSMINFPNEDILKLITLFPFSSIASTLPLSFGGLGMRELVFFLGADYYSLDKEWTVLASVIFFAITFLVSFLGIWYMIFPKKIKYK